MVFRLCTKQSAGGKSQEDEHRSRGIVVMDFNATQGIAAWFPLTAIHLASEWAFAWLNPWLVREIGNAILREL